MSWSGYVEAVIHSLALLIRCQIQKIAQQSGNDGMDSCVHSGNTSPTIMESVGDAKDGSNGAYRRH